MVAEPEIDVYYPCAFCDGSGFVSPPSGHGGRRESGKTTCKACAGSGEALKRVPLSQLGLKAP